MNCVGPRLASPLPAPSSPEFAALAARLGLAASSPPTVGQQLAVYRLASEVTQTALAASAGVRRATIADIESERGDGRNPKLAPLRALASALGVDLVIFSST